MTHEEAAIVQQAIAITERNMKTGSDVLANPDATQNYLRLQLAGLEHEMFGVLFLDVRHRVIENKALFRGTLDGASVYPREVAKECLYQNAAAVILYHNHPSGTPEPSRADKQITQRLQEALALFDIRVLDHIVTGQYEAVSMAERGMV